MSTSTFTIEDRLARYRPVLEAAISERASLPTESAPILDLEMIEFEQHLKQRRRTPNASHLLVAAAVVGLVVGLGAIVANRGTDTVTPTDTATPLDTGVPISGPVDEPVADTTDVVATAPVAVVPGSGQTPPCPSGTDTVGSGTLYLGGPSSSQNLATEGFIFSLPTGTQPVDVAIKAISLPILGLECGISAQPSADGSSVSVNVEPPAVPSPLEIEVAISATDDAVGVTKIDGNLPFEIVGGVVPSIRLIDGVPDSASSVRVRFKKGEDVWEFSIEPTTDVDVALVVPNGETDRFADQPVSWALLTALDSNDRVVGVSGQTIGQ